jgi:hypothetical protein
MNISYNVSPFFDDFPDVLTVLVPEGYFDTWPIQPRTHKTMWRWFEASER